MKSWLGSFALLVLCGCSVELPEGRFACSTAAQCPTDWSCVSGRCYSKATDAGSEQDGAHDADSDTGETIDAAPDATNDASQDAGHDAGHDASQDVNECAFPAAAAPTTVNSQQADTPAQATENAFAASGAWTRRSGDFFVGTWTDDSDLCGADDLTRDAFFKIELERQSTLQFSAKAEIDTKLVLAVFPGNASEFTLPQRAIDAGGARVACLSGEMELTQAVTLAAGEYFVVVKAHARCDLDPATCLLDPSATQDDAFSLEIRDLDLPTFPCDTSPTATCHNTSGAFTCTCPNGSSGNGEGPNGCR